MKKTWWALPALLLFAVPFVTSAAWWNPFSWNDPQPVPVRVGPVATTTVVAQKPTLILTPKPEIITKTVTQQVDNPALLIQIDSLQRENTTLKQELAIKPSVVIQQAPCPTQPTVDSRDSKLRELDQEMMDQLGQITVEGRYPQTSLTQVTREVNTIIEKYKIVDPAFGHANVLATQAGLLEFKSWLQSYIQYR